MTIQEYKEKFAALYEELEAEHGPMRNIYVERMDIITDFGEPAAHRIRVDINF